MDRLHRLARLQMCLRAVLGSALACSLLGLAAAQSRTAPAGRRPSFYLLAGARGVW